MQVATLGLHALWASAAIATDESAEQIAVMQYSAVFNNNPHFDDPKHDPVRHCSRGGALDAKPALNRVNGEERGAEIVSAVCVNAA